MEIKNVIICGLGAVGLTYAVQLKNKCDLKILVDESRKQHLKRQNPVFNGYEYDFEYILPHYTFKADLIIISTKASGLDDAMNYIQNFVDKDTIIISLLNGISSEDKIIQKYGSGHVLHSFYIGGSLVRINNEVKKYGHGKIVFGTPFEENMTLVEDLKTFLGKCNIEYTVLQDIIYAIWLKFGINVYLNQMSARLNMTMGELKGSKEFLELAPKLLHEVKLVAEKNGINNLDNFEDDAWKSLNLMADDGITSMLQDIRSERKTEVDIFAGEVVKLGKIYNIETPYNKYIYDEIKKLEQNF